MVFLTSSASAECLVGARISTRLGAQVWRRIKLSIVLSVACFSASGCAVQLAQLPSSSFNPPADLAPYTNADQLRSQALGSAARTVVNTSETEPSLAIDETAATPALLTDRTTDFLQRYGASDAIDDSRLQHSAASYQAQNADINGHTAGELAKSQNSYSLEAFNAPVEALLFALANDADLQLHLNGKIDAQITINAVDQSIDDIMTVLARQAGFSWQLENRDLSIWTGEAYTHTYPVNYLNIYRRTQSSVGLATQVGTINASNESGSSIANSSQTRIENTSEHNFWDSLLVDIQNVVDQGVSGDSPSGSSFSINREAGILTVHTKPSVHSALQRYLKVLHGTTQRQVLIEATVVEVALSENFDAGVDWQVLAKGVNGISAAQVLAGVPLVAAQTVGRLTGPAGLVSFVQEGGRNDVSATLSLLEQFGDVRILSRPRIIALNNQSSVLKVVDNRVYFTVNVQRRQTEERDEVITETEIHTVPVGLVMNVTPQISEHGMVMLNVRPTLSRILGFVNDPNPELALANVQNGVPEIQVREMESMLQVQSGNVAIIGGLMQETQSDNDTRLPGLGALPGIGRLFSSESRTRRQTELLIVLRPTVLGKQQETYQ